LGQGSFTRTLYENEKIINSFFITLLMYNACTLVRNLCWEIGIFCGVRCILWYFENLPTSKYRVLLL